MADEHADFCHIRQINNYDFSTMINASIRCNGEDQNTSFVSMKFWGTKYIAGFINNTNSILSADNIYYMDEYSQLWQNAPNCITMFVEDVCGLAISRKVNESTGAVSYSIFSENMYNGDKSVFFSNLITYLQGNTSKTLYTGSTRIPQFKAASSSTDLSRTITVTKNAHWVGLGNENAGSLVSMFTRPSTSLMNPSNLNNVANGCYPYVDDRILSDKAITLWTGEMSQLFYERLNSTIPNCAGFDTSTGAWIRDVTIDNNFYVISTGNQYITVPKFFEPIDYVIIGELRNCEPYALYRRVYFGIKSF